MITGHNCFGAVLYPITMADFIIADVTDAMLDGYIAGFPNTYAEKVGKTSDTLYKACFSAYMSMHCSSIFPRCTVPQSRSEPIPSGGRVPMCLHLCILPLVLCPGVCFCMCVCLGAVICMCMYTLHAAWLLGFWIGCEAGLRTYPATFVVFRDCLSQGCDWAV
jgi:hypothetical protein